MRIYIDAIRYAYGILHLTCIVPDSFDPLGDNTDGCEKTAT